MKLTKEKLKQIIKEELKKVLEVYRGGRHPLDPDVLGAMDVDEPEQSREEQGIDAIHRYGRHEQFADEPHGQPEPSTWRIFEPGNYPDDPYDEYIDESELEEDLEDIKALSPNWKKWIIEFPKGERSTIEDYEESGTPPSFITKAPD